MRVSFLDIVDNWWLFKKCVGCTNIHYWQNENCQCGSKSFKKMTAIDSALMRNKPKKIFGWRYLESRANERNMIFEV